MQEIRKLTEDELRLIKLYDTGYFNSEDYTLSFLHDNNVFYLSQLLSREEMLFILPRWRHHDRYTKEIIKKLISLLEYRYLGKIPFKKEYLDRKIDLNATRDNIQKIEIKYHEWSKPYSFILTDGTKISFESFFLYSRSGFLQDYFLKFVKDNEKKYPDGKAPIIDFLNYLSYNYMTTHIDDFPVFDLIVRTYISIYEGNNILEDREDIKNKRIRDLEELKEKRKEELEEYLHLEKEPNGEYNKYLQFYFQKVLDNNKPIKDASSIAEYIEDSIKYKYKIFDKIEFLFEILSKIEYFLKVFGIDKDKKMFDNIMDNLVINIKKINNEELREDKLYYAGGLKRILEFKFKYVTDAKVIEDFLLKEKEDSGYNWKNEMKYLYYLYEFIVPDELKNNIELIKSLLDESPDLIAFLYEYVDEKDKMSVLDAYYPYAYKYCLGILNKDEEEFVINKALETGGVFLQRHQYKYKNQKQIINAFKNSDLVTKIKEKNGDQLKKLAEKKGLDVNDNALLLRIFLGTSLLKTLYYDGYYDNDDIATVECIINLSELNGFKCTKTKERIAEYKKEIGNRERGICNYLSVNKDDDEKLDELLNELHVDKDNFFQYIKERKFMDKKLKELALLILAKHFKTSYISIYDIIDLIQEMSDKELTLDEILNQKNINKKLFYKIYDEFEVTNPEIYNYIKQNLHNNSLHGFKKLLKLYYKIMNSKVNNYGQFLDVFKSTPDEILELFRMTPMYDDLYKMISSWYILDSNKTPVIEQTK